MSDPLVDQRLGQHVGRTIGRCQLERRLGAGAMGAVYAGQHLTLRIPVAVKILAPAPAAAASPGAQWAARFMREAQLAATLRHPNIVRIYDVGEEAGAYFIIMELLSGTTLKQRLAGGPLPVDQARALAGQVAAALAHAHAKGVIHRDVKPDNVMVTDDGTAVLTDFGIAAAERPQERLTQQGVTMGTPWYIAPEQAQAREVDGRADLYSFGVMLYEMLTGRLPFPGDDALKQMLARLTDDPVPISTYRPDLAPDLVALVGRLLAREPARRVQTAVEVAAALGAGLADRSVAPPLPLAQSGALPVVDRRTTDLVAMTASAGLPLATPPGAHVVDLKLADVRATLKLAEEESAGGAALLLLHQLGRADAVAFVAGTPSLALRVVRGVPEAVPVRTVVALAMARGDGALVVRSIEPSVVETLRRWVEGPRLFGPLPADIVRPTGLFARLGREQASGVLAVTDDAKTTLVAFEAGTLAGVLAPPGDSQVQLGESGTGLLAWLGARSPEATLEFRLAAAAGPAQAPTLPDATLRAALDAAAAAVAVLLGEARREFGLGSVPVFSKYLREATAGLRDVVPLAALGGPAGAVDVELLWHALGDGARVGRDLVVRILVEALVRAGLQAATEILPARRVARARKAALDGALRARDALDALEVMGPVVALLGN